MRAAITTNPSLNPAQLSSFSNKLTKVPICGRISTANSSPRRSVTLGSLPTPTPAGVPVMMTVPAGSVVPCDRKLTSLGMLKMRSLRIACRVRPCPLHLGFLRISTREGFVVYGTGQAHSAPQSCRTSPFLSPRTRNAEGSGTSAADSSVGPASFRISIHQEIK